MEHLAIDLGGRKSQICVRAADGTILEERSCETRSLGSYLKRRPPSRVVLETCAEAFSVADEARELGHDVRVVPAKLAPLLGIGERRTKTDVRDARKLSEVSTRIELAGVHVPSAQARERKALCATRDSLVRARTRLINHTRGLLRTFRVRIRPGETQSFVKRAMQGAAHEMPASLEHVLPIIEQLSERIAVLDAELATLAKKDEVCRRMMTVPGVGPVTAVRFQATLDTWERFDSAHKVEAYLGLTPGEASSSDHRRRTGITKAGPSAMRWTLVQAAWCARRTKGTHPLLAWAAAVEHRRGKHVAATALARKLAGILWAIWKHGSTYQPTRAATLES